MARHSAARAVLLIFTLSVAGVTPAQEQRSPATVPGRLAEMQHHFTEVGVLHDALIRGDLAAVRGPALALAAISVPATIPAPAVVHVDDIRASAQQAAEATTLTAAAVATATMLRECGDCHRAVGIYPATRTRIDPDIGGIGGHMLAHQRATDDLLRGLIVPSTSAWQAGAEALGAAPLRPGDLPVGPRQAADLIPIEREVHRIVDRAIVATTSAERGRIYAELVTTCSGCHQLHRKIWGPTPGR